jgi:hypothetical protein
VTRPTADQYLEAPIIAPTAPIDPDTHTMTRPVFVDYVTKSKFSQEQYALLDDAISKNDDISIHGYYIEWLPTFLAHYGLTLDQAPLVRPPNARYRSPKMYNCYRPVLLSVTRKDGRREIIALAFPSHEYVHQYAEVLASLVAIRSDQLQTTYTKQVKRYHYVELESTLAEWTGLRKGLEALDADPSVVIMGEIELLLGHLKALDFSHYWPPMALGIDGIFGMHVLQDRRDERRLYLFGAKHNYWGSAAGQIAAALAHAGAKHIIYVGKSGTFIAEERVHGIFLPNNYLLLSDDPHEGCAEQINSILAKSPIRDLKGFMTEIRTGCHLTVPTVTGETYRQRERYESYGPTTIDNEISFIAKAVSHLKTTHGRTVSFTPLHFITDYLYEVSESKGDSAGNLATKSENYYHIKRERFLQIARIISTYGALVDMTLIDHPESGRHWQYTITDIVRRWLECKTLLASEKPMAFAREGLTRFLLRARYAAYYNGDVTWLSTMERICDSVSRWQPSLKSLSEGFSIIKELNELAVRRRTLSENETRKLNGLAKRAGALAAALGDPYERYVMTVTRVQALLRYCTNVDQASRQLAIGELELALAEAESHLAESMLLESDVVFERLHLQRLSALVALACDRKAESIEKLQQVVTGWGELLESTDWGEHEWIMYAEIALTKAEMLSFGYRPPSTGWLRDLRTARELVTARFDILDRLRVALTRGDNKADDGGTTPRADGLT